MLYDMPVRQKPRDGMSPNFSYTLPGGREPPWYISPGVRIVVASPIFPKKAYRGRKETGRAVLFT